MSFRLLLLSFLSALALSTPAHAWWNDEWTVRKQITIDPAAGAVAGPVGSSVILLRLHDGNFLFQAGKDDGSDIRVVAEDDKTLLPYHLERFDAVLNEGFVWVKVPEVKAGGKTVLWLYSGNQGEKATSVQDAKATYDAETQLVYHFGDKGAPTDASGKGHAASNGGLAITGSLIGGGVRLDGRTPITIPAAEGLNWTAGTTLTWSAWIKPSALAPDSVVFSRRDGGSTFLLGLTNGTPYVDLNGQRESATKPVEVNTWHHLAVVAEGGKTTLYVDGEAAPALAASIPALTSPLLLGGDTVEGATGFAGEIDELAITKSPRSAGWVKLAAVSQGVGEGAGKVVAFGTDEQSGGGGGGHSGYFTVIVNSLTIDGWVVIGILGVMLAISWYVMFSKISYLNALSKGNERFMKEWTHVVTDLTVLDHGAADSAKSLGGRVNPAAQKAMRQSSVYRIYHLGVEEIRHRLAADHSAKVLSARSIQSIRATLDGGLVREKQRIDKLIVLLTICISGGPFLGLLGTVVGVMITFAAVAAAGDVNVNAIAPGIAAALLATVAGLAVAIPALFGYNYILSRVKDATADMHVFIDEFVTRMAEFYSEPETRPTVRPEYAKQAAETSFPELEGASV